jgi:hypothetical protein
MMRVVIAPDSFKESLSAAGVADAIALGVRDAAPDAEVICVPMADGGEGSLDAVLDATGGERRSLQVRDAIGRPCQASWGWLGEGRAFVEMAAAAGLENIAPEDRDALRASTFGVGQLIWDAVQAGARHIVLGLGGSATNDAGAGLLQALGCACLTDKDRIFLLGASLCPGWPVSTAMVLIRVWPKFSLRLPSMSTIRYAARAAHLPSSGRRRAHRPRMCGRWMRRWRILRMYAPGISARTNAIFRAWGPPAGWVLPSRHALMRAFAQGWS